MVLHPILLPTNFMDCLEQALLTATIKGQDGVRDPNHQMGASPQNGTEEFGHLPEKQASWVSWELNFLLNAGLLATCWLWDYIPVPQG